MSFSLVKHVTNFIPCSISIFCYCSHFSFTIITSIDENTVTKWNGCIISEPKIQFSSIIGADISYGPFTERIVSLNLPTSCFQRKRLSSISKCVGTVSDNEGISCICWKFCINVTFTLSTLKPRYNAIRHVMPPQIAKSVITVTLLPICHDNITKIIKIDVVSLFISRPMDSMV